MAIYVEAKGIAGSSVEECAKGMIELSRKLGVMVSLNFNGVHLLANEMDSVFEIERKYLAEINRRPRPAPDKEDKP